MWKYANPGNYKLLNHHEGLSYENITDETKAPSTGCCYTNKTKADFPIILPDNSDEIWFRADVYIEDKVYIEFCNDYQNKHVLLTLMPEGWHLEADHRGYSYEMGSFADLQMIREENRDLNKRVVTVLLHIKSVKMHEGSIFNTAGGLVELRLNNRIIANFLNLGIMNGESLFLSTISSEEGKSYFSNIIVSNEEVISREKVCLVPVKSIVLDGWSEVTNDDSTITYVTDSADKSVIYTLDTDAIKRLLGDNISISSISLQAFDISTDDENEVNAIQKIVRFGNNEFTSNTTQILYDSRYISEALLKNPATNHNWTLEDLETAEFILRTTKIET